MSVYPELRVWLDVHADAYEDPFNWQEITDYAEEFHCQYGRSSLLDEFAHGTGSILLNNNDGRFDPTNTAGPYYPNLRPRNRIKIEARYNELLEYQTWDSAGTWTPFGSGGVVVSSGNLTITSSTGVDDRGVYKDYPQPFENFEADATFQISSTPWPSSAIFYPLYVRSTADDTNAAYFMAVNGTLYAVLANSYGGTALWSASYSTISHANVRIRREGADVYFDVLAGPLYLTVAHAEVPLGTEGTVRVSHWVSTSDSSGITDTLTVSETGVRRQATYPVAYGWVDGWPVSQEFRDRSTVRVSWHDALGVLAKARPPDSVWDRAISGQNWLGRVWAWWKMGSTSGVEVDASGHGRDARYIVYQGDAEPSLLGSSPDVWQLPPALAADALVDNVIPASGRPGRSWAKMQADVGQPLGGSSGKYPRTPSLVCRIDSSNPFGDGNFAFETWVIARQAFPIDVTGGPASTFPMYQPVFTIGTPLEEPWIEFGITDQGKPYAGLWEAGWSDLRFDIELFDGRPHHLFFRVVDTVSGMVARVYVDGVEVGSGVLLGEYAQPGPGYLIVIGQGLSTPRGLQSTIGDVVVYDAIMPTTVIESNYTAGLIGSWLSGAELTSGEAVSDLLAMIGWDIPTDIDPGAKTVFAGPMVGRSVLDVLREYAGAERAPFFQAPDGTLTLLGRYWQVELDRAKAPLWRLGDDAGATLGYSALDFTFDDRTIINHAEVAYTEGVQTVDNTASQAKYGRLDASAGTGLTSATDALALAEWLAYAYGEPRRRVDRPLVVEPVTDRDFTFVLGVKFGTRITLVRVTPDGRTVEDDYWVQSIAHRVESGQGAWRTEITLERADDPYRIFTLAGPGTWPGSELDGPDVLGF